jgi:hypothetical protein
MAIWLKSAGVIIGPVVRSGRRAIVVAHGNTLRSPVMYLNKIPEDKIGEVNIPTGIPLVYELFDDMEPLNSYYLGDRCLRRTQSLRALNQNQTVIRCTRKRCW